MHHDDGYSISEIADRLHLHEDAVKMRLYRARKKLRILLISLLLLVLLTAVGIGSGLWDVDWFLSNRRAEPISLEDADFQSVIELSYASRYLNAECIDVKWNMEQLELFIAYSLTGIHDGIIIVHSNNAGVDGIRDDHIWIDGEVQPIDQWADGHTVYICELDEWTIHGHPLYASSDSVTDGKGQTYMEQLQFSFLTPETYEEYLNGDTMILENQITIMDYATQEIIEKEYLQIYVSAPNQEEWRLAYEMLDR